MIGKKNGRNIERTSYVDLNRVMLTVYYILRNIDRVSSAIYHRARINGWIRGTRYFYT